MSCPPFSKKKKNTKLPSSHLPPLTPCRSPRYRQSRPTPRAPKHMATNFYIIYLEKKKQICWQIKTFFYPPTKYIFLYPKKTFLLHHIVREFQINRFHYELLSNFIYPTSFFTFLIEKCWRSPQYLYQMMWHITKTNVEGINIILEISMTYQRPISIIKSSSQNH